MRQFIEYVLGVIYDTSTFELSNNLLQWAKNLAEIVNHY